MATFLTVQKKGHRVKKIAQIDLTGQQIIFSIYYNKYIEIEIRYLLHIKELKIMFELELRKLGGKIAYYRKLRDFTQKDLATRADISVSYLSRIERGIYIKGIPVSTLMRIARGLDVNVNKLLDKD